MAETQLRRMIVLQNIPRYPKKISTRQLLERVMAQGVESNIRAIQRDLEHISATGLFGIGADTSSKPAGWYWVKDSGGLQFSIMDINTAIAFEQLRVSAKGLLPKSTQDDLAPYFLQAEKLLKHRKSWDKKIAFVSRVSVAPPDIEESDRDRLYEAIDDELCISASIGDLYKGELIFKFAELIQPLGLMVSESKTYLVLTIGRRKPLFCVPLYRIKGVALLKESVLPPEGFDLAKYVVSDPLKRRYQRNIALTMNVSAAVANFIYENPIARDQKVTAGGEGWFHFSATVDDTNQLRATLRGFGDEVKILSPERLRFQIHKSIE